MWLLLKKCLRLQSSDIRGCGCSTCLLLLKLLLLLRCSVSSLCLRLQSCDTRGCGCSTSMMLWLLMLWLLMLLKLLLRLLCCDDSTILTCESRSCNTAPTMVSR